MYTYSHVIPVLAVDGLGDTVTVVVARTDVVVVVVVVVVMDVDDVIITDDVAIPTVDGEGTGEEGGMSSVN